MNLSSKIQSDVLLPDPWSYDIQPQPHELKNLQSYPIISLKTIKKKF